MKKILITGASGYIGSKLTTYLQISGYEVVTVSRRYIEKGNHYVVDYSDCSKIEEIIINSIPDVVIHTASISSLTKCEQEKELAHTVNVEWTRNIVNTLSSFNRDIKLVFLSSDYVFDGIRGNYSENDEVNPFTYYGKTKVDAEDIIKNSGIKHIICRTASVFGGGGNLYQFLYENLSSDNTIEVFCDTFFSPTYIEYFLDSLRILIERDFEGIVHLAGSERVSRFQFALELTRKIGKNERLVVPVKRYEDTLIADDCSLNTSMVQGILGNYCPTFEKSIQFALGQICYPYFLYSDQRGLIRGIVQESQWEEINYVESTKGTVRGNHYHKISREGFFIIEGKIQVTLQSLNPDRKVIFSVNEGDAFYAEPNTLHTFYILENAKWINFLSKAMKGDSKDIYRSE